MPQLFIPDIGTEFKLSQAWTFDLYNERRNETLMRLLGDNRPTCFGGRFYPPEAIEARLEAGATLKLDRVYIRKGNEEMSSITFLLVGEALPAREIERTAVAYGPTPGQREAYSYTIKLPKKPIRFWVKLEDANKIIFD